MKISTNSWHYKLISEIHGVMNMPSDVCEYIRSVFSAFIIAVFIGILGTIASFSIVAPILYIIYPTSGVIENASMIGIIIYILILAFFFNKWYWEIPRSNKKRKIYLVEQYFKDKHDKICSLIEYDFKNKGEN